MKIHDNEGKLLAIIVKKNEQTAGKNFYTDNSSELQLATFELSDDEIIDRHIHDEQIRNIVRTSEAIILQEGVLVFDIYDNDLNPITQVSLEAGDIILLLDGGHLYEFQPVYNYKGGKIGRFRAI